eukprot:scaffold13142_cov15-Tisochrysis_lutea.AAC.2
MWLAGSLINCRFLYCQEQNRNNEQLRPMWGFLCYFPELRWRRMTARRQDYASAPQWTPYAQSGPIRKTACFITITIGLPDSNRNCAAMEIEDSMRS